MDRFEAPKPHVFEADKLPRVRLTNGLLFQLIATEIALQRNELGAAYKTYISMAESTRDPRLAERATRIAQAANAPNEIKNAVILWNKLAPGNKDAQELLIHTALFFGEYTKILPLTKSFLSQLKDPNEELLKIQLFLAQGQNKEKGLQFFQTVSKPYGKYYATQLGLARLELLTGKTDAALKNARTAYSKDQNTDTVSVLAGVLLKENPQQALPLLSDYIAKHPDDRKIRDAYAKLLVTSGEKGKLDSLAKTYADDGKFAITMALTYLQGKEPEKAIGVLKTFLAASAKDQTQQHEANQANLLLSQFALDQKKFAEALAYASEIKSGPLKPLGDLQMATIFHREGDSQKALFYLNAAQPQNADQTQEIILQKAKLFSEISGDEEAYKYVLSELKKNPNLRDVQYDAAVRAESLGNFPAAEKHLREAIRLDPNFANAYNSLGYSLLENGGNLSEARECIEKAFSLEPENPFILDSLGWLRFKEGRYADAVELLRKAVSMREDEEIVLHLIEALWQNGDDAEAAENLQKAEENWPDSEGVKKLQALLSKDKK